MHRAAEANHPVSARRPARVRTQTSRGWARRVLLPLGTLWVILLLGFGLYYVLDQTARQGPSGQTVLNLEIQRAEGAVRGAPNNLSARIAVADLYSEAGRHQEAAEQFQAVLQMDDGNLPAANGLASAYEGLGQGERAVPILQKAIRQNQDLKVVRTSKDMGEAHLRLGRAYFAQGATAEARVEAEAAQKNLPADADVLLLLGQTLAQTGDPAGAVEQYRKALRLVPRFSEAYQAMAAAYEALADGPRAAHARAMVIYSRGDYVAAARELEGLAGAEPGLAEARLGLGMAYERLGRPAEAAAAYREALRLDPEMDYARVRLAGLGEPGAGQPGR